MKKTVTAEDVVTAEQREKWIKLLEDYGVTSIAFQEGLKRGVLSDVAEFLAKGVTDGFSRRKFREFLGLIPLFFDYRVKPIDNLREAAYAFGVHEVGPRINWSTFRCGVRAPYNVSAYLVNSDNLDFSELRRQAAPEILHQTLVDATKGAKMRFAGIEELITFTPYYRTWTSLKRPVVALRAARNIDGTMSVARLEKVDGKIVLTTKGFTTTMDDECQFLMIKK